MKFHDYIDAWTLSKRMVSSVPELDEFYQVTQNMSENTRDAFSYRQAMLEHDWIKLRRPYYNVWPAILPMIKKLRLDLPCTAIKLQFSALLLRLPDDESNPYVLPSGNRVKSVLVGHQMVNSAIGKGTPVNGLCVVLDTGEIDTGTKLPVHTFKIFPLREDMSVEEAVDVLPYHKSWQQGMTVPQELINEVVRLCCCVALIGQDKDLVTPDVLAKDRDKYRDANEAQREAIVERAVRRGKHGFDLGKEMEMIPHYRRPHPALVWTGEGRKIPRIVLRKGSVVHREVISKVPTGFKGDA